MTEPTHQQHLDAHNEFRRAMKEDWELRYRIAPRWRRWLIDRLLK